MQMLLPGVVDGEGDGDGCALAKGGGDVKFAAQRADDLIDDGQPDARAAHRVFRLEKLLLDLSRSSGAMPRPWSRMDALTVTGVRLSVRKIVPPGSEYLIALSNRFTNTCRSRAGSAQTGYGSGGSE